MQSKGKGWDPSWTPLRDVPSRGKARALLWDSVRELHWERRKGKEWGQLWARSKAITMECGLVHGRAQSRAPPLLGALSKGKVTVSPWGLGTAHVLALRMVMLKGKAWDPSWAHSRVRLKVLPMGKELGPSWAHSSARG